MRKWKVETPYTEWSNRKEEIIEADWMEGFDGFVEFYIYVKYFPRFNLLEWVDKIIFGVKRSRVIAVRMNCNVSEITEEEK